MVAIGVNGNGYRKVIGCAEASAKAGSVATELESMKLKEAAKVVREGFAETLT